MNPLPPPGWSPLFFNVYAQLHMRYIGVWSRNSSRCFFKILIFSLRKSWARHWTTMKRRNCDSSYLRIRMQNATIVYASNVPMDIISINWDKLKSPATIPVVRTLSLMLVNYEKIRIPRFFQHFKRWPSKMSIETEHCIPNFQQKSIQKYEKFYENFLIENPILNRFYLKLFLRQYRYQF